MGGLLPYHVYPSRRGGGGGHGFSLRTQGRRQKEALWTRLERGAGKKGPSHPSMVGADPTPFSWSTYQEGWQATVEIGLFGEGKEERGLSLYRRKGGSHEKNLGRPVQGDGPGNLRHCDDSILQETGKEERSLICAGGKAGLGCSGESQKGGEVNNYRNSGKGRGRAALLPCLYWGKGKT